MEDLPVTLKAIVDRSQVKPVTVGMSSDKVYKLEADTVYYLKIGAALRDECKRLEWLEGRLSVPRVLHFEVNHGKHYMLTSAIEGEMLFEAEMPVAQALELYAEAAHLWHDQSIADCPFQSNIQTQIESARHALDHNRVDESRFESRFYGKRPQELFADLLNAMPDTKEDFVLSHGDFSLPNVLVDSKQKTITGFVDLGQIAVSDRYLDLVTASQSIRYNFGSKYIPRFYELYGLEIDYAKQHFYNILNEFI